MRETSAVKRDGLNDFERSNFTKLFQALRLLSKVQKGEIRATLNAGEYSVFALIASFCKCRHLSLFL